MSEIASAMLPQQPSGRRRKGQASCFFLLSSLPFVHASCFYVFTSVGWFGYNGFAFILCDFFVFFFHFSDVDKQWACFFFLQSVVFF